MIELTDQIISSDTLNIFLYSVIAGLILGIAIGIFVHVTKFLWR